MSVEATLEQPDIWRALANPWRREILDRLGEGPMTTGALAAQLPDVSRFAVMQHLEVLVDAQLVAVERRGRERFNHLNAVPLRRWYERWVAPMADRSAQGLLSVRRAAEQPADKAAESTGDESMRADQDQVRTVRIVCEVPIRAGAERVFEVVTQEYGSWFPHSYGGERTRRVVVEPEVGGRHYEDWGDGAGYLYGHVTVWDPPLRLGTRGRIMPGTVLDTDYEIAPGQDGVVLRVSKVASGPISEDDAAGIQEYGDVSRYADAIRALAEG